MKFNTGKIANAFSGLQLFLLIFLVLIQTASSQNSVSTSEVDDSEQKALELYQFAEGMREREFYDLAAAEYEKLIKNHPTFSYLAEAYYYWAECLRLHQQSGKAIEIFNELRKRYSKHPLASQAVVNLATIFIDTEKLDQANRILHEALDNKTLDLKFQEAIYYFLGDVYRKKQELERAVEYLSKISSLKIDPKYQYRSYALLNLGFVYRSMENYKSASECFIRLVNDAATPESIKEESFYQLGETKSANKNYADALVNYEKILLIYPNGKFAQQAKIGKGWALLRLQKYEDCLQFLDSDAIKNIPQTGEMLYLYGLSLKFLQRFEDALQAYHQLIKEFPNDKFVVYAEYDAIESHYDLKRYDQCLAKIDGFLSQFSKHQLTSEVLYYKGRCLFALDRPADAANVYEETLKELGESWEHAEEVLMLLADSHRQNNEFKKAARVYQRLSQLDESELKAKSLMLAAECQALANDGEVAREFYSMVVSEYPTAPEAPLALLNLAELETKVENFKKGIHYLDRYLSQYPNHDYIAKALYLRGALHYYDGQHTKAIDDLKQSLENSEFEQKDFAQLFLAYTLWELNSEKESLTYLAGLLKKKSTVFEDNLIPELLNEMGNEFLELNNLEAAERCFTIIKDHSDLVWNLYGLLGVGKAEYRKKNFEKAVRIFYDLKSKTAQHPELRGTSLAYLGECLRSSGKLDEAFVIFKEASNLVYDDSKAKALVRLGIARINFENNEYDDALRYAISVYVLYDDADLAPEAMLIAIKILTQKKRTDEAKNTYEEFKKRYPETLAAFKSEKENSLLFEQF